MNVYNTDKSRLTRQELAMACNTVIRQKYNKEFTLEFSRDRKSMSTYVTSANGNGSSQSKRKMFVKGAPESVIERCSYVRVGTERMSMTPKIKAKIMEKIHQYGIGGDALRCLALGTIDEPLNRNEMNLEDPTKFADYEVRVLLHI